MNERFRDFVTFVPYSIGTNVTNFGKNFELSLGLALCLELERACDMNHAVYILYKSSLDKNFTCSNICKYH